MALNKPTDNPEKDSSDAPAVSKTIQGLVSQRASCVRTLKKTFSDLQDTITENDSDQTEVFLALLNSKWEKIKELNSKLQAKEGSDEYLHEETYMNYEDEVLVANVRAKQVLRRVQQQLPINSAPTHVPTRKLAALELKKFNGDIQQWRQWWEAYRVSVHENQTLQDVEKFGYLENHLEGNAAKLIKGLPITGSSYARAIKLLEDRFGQTELIKRSHVDSLLNLPKVEKIEHTRNLATLVDTALANIRALEDLSVPLKDYSVMINHVLLNRIPKELELMWYRTPNYRTASVNELIEFIQNELVIQESINQPTRYKQTNQHHGNHHRGNNSSHHHSTTAQLVVNETSSTGGARSKQPFCAYCKICHERDPCEKTLQEKKDIVAREKRCYHCLSRKHTKCDRRCPHCNNKHHITLCPSKNSTAPVTVTSLVHLPILDGNRSVLMTATVWVEGPNGSKKVVLLYDGGAQRSFVSKKLAAELNLQVNGIETHQFQSFGGHVGPTKAVNRFNVNIKSSQPGSEAIQMSLLGTDSICQTPPYHSTEFARDIKESGKWLADERIVRRHNMPNEVDILIGTDYYRTIVLNEVITSNVGLAAVNTVFGWALHGTIPASNPTEVLSVMSLLVDNHDAFTAAADLHAPTDNFVPSPDVHQTNESFDLRAFWTLEACGIQPGDETTNPFVTSYESQITKNQEGRYVAPLPWNEKVNQLQPNRIIAQRCLDGLLKRLRTKPNLLKAYHNQIEEYIKLGFIKKASPDFNGVYTYLPHHPVVRNDKTTTKVRPVFNGASKPKGGVSVNDCLESGPNLNPELLAVMLRFRTFKYAWVSDIEKAFLQVALTETDSEALRFLWISNPEDPNSPTIELTWARLPFGLTSSPFILRMVILTHIKKYEKIYPESVALIRDQLYVDDQLGGANSMKLAKSFISQILEIFSDARLDMRKWIANLEELLQEVQTTESVDGLIGSLLTSADSSKVLGLGWNPRSDEFYYDASKFQERVVNLNDSVTKRQFISISSQLFDPIGALGPYNLISKILYKKIWEANTEWDQPIPNNLFRRWKEALDSLNDLSHFHIPRRIAYMEPGLLNIHIFCDASEEAYGAVAYVRGKNDLNETVVTLLCCKTRVAPSKSEMSLARKELMAALLGAQLSSYIRIAFHSISIVFHFWSDSLITLGWINGDPQRWKPFIRNRIITITQLSNRANWAHCPGLENPADLASRGATVAALNQKFWLQGPEWLQQDEVNWPQHPTYKFDLSLVNEELSVAGRQTLVAALNLGAPEPFPFTHYGTFSKIIRIRAWMNRAMKPKLATSNTSCVTLNLTNGNTVKIPALTSNELYSSRVHNLQLIQQTQFKNEYELLSNGKSLPRSHNWTPLRPIWDPQEKLIRVTGRVEHQFLEPNSMAPILLPNNHHVTNLIIKEAHVKVGHSGISATLAEIREAYWFIHGREKVKKVLASCTICKKAQSPSFDAIAAALPPCRVQETRPFDVIGLDFAGPLFTREAKSRTIAKAYILLITCATTRAIHVELIRDMSVITFICALRKFIARRGIPATIYSDNAKTFKMAASYLKTITEDLKVIDFLAKNNVSWKFSANLAPWWGGWWERMIRTLKQGLRKTIGRTLLSFLQLETALLEAENVINCRPLTYTTNDLNEAVPLTPSHLIYGKKLNLSVSQSYSAEPIPTSTKEQLVALESKRNRVLTHWWNCWRREYLRDLTRFHASNRSTRTIQVGEIVLVHEANTKRQLWPYGLVTRLLPGSDGITRAVELKLKSGITTRPIQKLYPLEVVTINNEVDTGNTNQDDAASFNPPETQEPSSLNNIRTTKKTTSKRNSSKKSIDHTDQGGEDVAPRYSSRGRLLRPNPRCS